MRFAEELVPLYSVESEMGVLGSMLLSQRAAEELSGVVNPDDFYRPGHRHIFRAIKQLVDTGKAVDFLTLKEELVARGMLAEIGGEDYLLEVAEFTPTAVNFKFYAGIIQDKAALRRLENAGREIVGIATTADETSVKDKIDTAEQMLYNVARDQLGKDFAHVSSLAKEFFADIDTIVETGEPIHGVYTGFGDLDAMTTGFYPGDLIIVAARPSMGKTSFVLDIGQRVARHGQGAVAIFSLEMTGSQLVRRLTSMISGVGSYEMKRQNLPEKSYHALADACETLYNLPIYIDDSSEVTSLEMKGKCRRLAQEQGLAMIIVDYLQLMRGSRKTENRVQEISDIARGLKAIAKDLGVPVIALSQLNRAVELRDDKRPQLSDIRESGSIEAEADMVMMLYRDSYYEDRKNQNNVPKEENRVEVAEIGIMKHRNGEVGPVLLGFQPSYARFRSIDEQSKTEYWQSVKEKQAAPKRTAPSRGGFND